MREVVTIFRRISRGGRLDKHRIAVWMNKVNMAWRSEKAFKMDKSAKACIRSIPSLSSAPRDAENAEEDEGGR